MKKARPVDDFGIIGYLSRVKVLTIALSVVALLSNSIAFAALEGDAKSIQKDAKSLGVDGTKIVVTSHPKYTLHEISQNWATVHEFTGSNGKVFALAWRGKKHPNMQSIFGHHISNFQKAISQARSSHRHGGTITATVKNLHVEMGGHMGAVYGRVWLTDKIPSGLDLHEIK